MRRRGRTSLHGGVARERLARLRRRDDVGHRLYNCRFWHAFGVKGDAVGGRLYMGELPLDVSTP